MFTCFKLTTTGAGGAGAKVHKYDQRQRHGNTARDTHLVGVSRDHDVHVKLSLDLMEVYTLYSTMAIPAALNAVLIHVPYTALTWLCSRIYTAILEHIVLLKYPCKDGYCEGY